MLELGLALHGLEGERRMGKQFSDLDAIQALTALNWWTCYANTTGKKIAWIPTIQALFYTNAANKTPGGGQSVKNRMLDPMYYNKLMKLIPYGLADGTLSSSFPDPYELLVFLMRSVGIEEAIIQDQLLSEGVTDPAKYMLNSVVKQQGKAFADQVIEVAKTQGVDAAQQVIDSYKATGQIPNTSTTRNVKLPRTVPKRQRSSIPGMRGLGNPNSSRQPSINPAMFLLIPIGLMALRKMNNR